MENQKSDPSDTSLAQNLRYLRQHKKWTQEFLAEQLQVSRQAVVKWQNGDSLPDIQKCVQLAIK